MRTSIDEIIAVRGRLLFINASNIFLRDCQIIDFKDG
jgi:hypothetical protein